MPEAGRSRTGETVAQLKDDIDSGRTGSKVATADPGLSPLGTDDEAAGRPASPERIAMARAEEKRIGDVARAGDAPKSFAPAGWMIAVIAVIAVVIVTAYMLHRG